MASSLSNNPSFDGNGMLTKCIYCLSITIALWKGLLFFLNDCAKKFPSGRHYTASWFEILTGAFSQHIIHTNMPETLMRTKISEKVSKVRKKEPEETFRALSL